MFGILFAICLGKASANIYTIDVTIIDAINDTSDSSTLIINDKNKEVETIERRILTILLPINIATRVLSNVSITLQTAIELALFFFDSTWKRYLFKQVKEVSAMEKKKDRSKNNSEKIR